MGSPNQAWRFGGDKTNSYNGVDEGYQQVNKGNVLVSDPNITDPGQIGQGNVPGWHDANSAAGDPRAYVPMPNVDAMVTRDGSRFTNRLMPGRWTPNILRGMTEEHATDGGTYPAKGQNPFGPPGSPEHNLETQEHGPVTAAELERVGNVRQPQGNAALPWWRKMLGNSRVTAPRDNLNARSENVVAPMGIHTVREEEADASASALGTGNQFVMPDVRRTFDHPLTAENIVTDQDGKQYVAKAGYALTATPLEGQPWSVKTDHAYDVQGQIEIDEINPDRVRAGVAKPFEGREAKMPHWFYFSPFDQWAMHHAYGFKGQLTQPLASRPIFTKSEQMQQDASSAGGPRYYSPAPGMEAAGIQPNLDRQSPQPWDTNLVNSGQPSDSSAGMSRVSGAAARGWGSR